MQAQNGLVKYIHQQWGTKLLVVAKSICQVLLGHKQVVFIELLNCVVYGVTYAFSQCVIFFMYAVVFRFGAFLVTLPEDNVARVFSGYKWSFHCTVLKLMLNHAHLLKSQFLAHLLYFWSIVLCPVLTAPKSGRVRWDGTRPNSVAQYSCYSGYTLSGQVTRTCLSTGEWSGSAPVCESKWTLAGLHVTVALEYRSLPTKWLSVRPGT